MTDEIKLHKQRARGQEAKRLWENSMIQEFFTTMQQTVMDAWRDSKGDEADVRERAYLMMRLHENYKQQFRSFIYTGEIASRELLSIEQRKESQQ
jgi:5'-deoxynucleotidase YfbR-like HD superfamily hydrolase